MEKDKDIIIQFLLDKVSELNVENKRLNGLVNSLHADCYFYENYWQPKPEAKKKKKRKEKEILPF